MNKTGRAAVAAAGVVAGLALVAGCTPGGDPTVVTPSGAASTASGAASEAPVTKVSETGVNEPPALKDGATSIILDVRPSTCESGPGKVKASGTVTNNAEAARDIVVTASWNTPDNSKTFAKSSAVLKAVPAGQTRGYEIGSTVEAPKDTAIVCTFSAMSGALK